MELKLYHYVHCPFCIRVRMALGYFKLPYESIVVPYDDEITPVKLTGAKMLPIMEIKGKAQNESLDIIEHLDQKNIWSVSDYKKGQAYNELSHLLNKLGANVHNLAMPYWIYTPEFDENSRQYFQKKKEEKRGPFKNLVKKREQFTKDILKDLNELSGELKPFYHSETFGLDDILLASHLWGLYIVPEFQFPEKIHHYLQQVKNICHFDYHHDYWK